jgi:low affinity Fe/Cu permease
MSGLTPEGLGSRRGASRHPESRMLHALDRLSAHPSIAGVVVIADLIWVTYSAVFGFPTRLETIFQTLVAAITMAMVFVIQHTQAREQAATQRKLDEILRALPGADNAMISLEEAHDDDLRAAKGAHRELRHDATPGAPAAPGERRWPLRRSALSRHDVPAGEVGHQGGQRGGQDLEGQLDNELSHVGSIQGREVWDDSLEAAGSRRVAR